jgi:predicted Zn-dependent protease
MQGIFQSLNRVLLLACLFAAPHRASADAYIEPDPQLGFSSEEFAQRGREAFQQKLAVLAARGQLGCTTQYCTGVREIFARIVAAARTQGDKAATTRWELVITTAPDEDASAFASGQILVSSTFLQQHGLTQSEIAYVLAHEVSHILLEHARAYATVALALMPHKVRHSLSDVYAEIDFDLGFALQLAPFDMDAEFEADEAGLILGAMAGYQPREMLPLFTKLEGESTGGVLPSHGSPAERLKRAEATLPLAERIYGRYAGDGSGAADGGDAADARDIGHAMSPLRAATRRR